jgi:PAS domain S-box-containing protein
MEDLSYPVSEGTSTIVGLSEEDRLRRSGIEVVGSVPWGTHFCQFYATKEDLIEALVPYFREGLQAHEFCMWVTSAPLQVEEATQALRIAVPDLDQYINSGQMEILDYTQWYTKKGAFDAGIVLQGWMDKLQAALQRGFEGLRLTGNTFWLEQSDWDDFYRYEEVVNSVIGQHRMLAVCTYSLEKCGAKEIIDVIDNHQFALIKRAGRWEIIESAHRKKTEHALRESEDKLKSLFSTMAEGFALHEILYNANRVPVDYRIIDVNTAFEQQTSIPVGKARGAVGSELFGMGTAPYLEIYARVAETGVPETFSTFFAPMNRYFDISCFSPKKGWFATVFSDVTSRKRTEQELVRRNEDLSAMNEELTAIEEELRQNNDELIKAQKDLLEHESLLRSFFESPGFLRGVMEVSENDILHINSNLAAAEFFGQTKKSMMNTCLSQLGVPEEIVRLWVEKADESRRSGKPVQFEFEYGTGPVRKWLAPIVSYLGLSSNQNPCYSYVMDDITERKKVELELRETSQYLEHLISYANAPIIVWNPEFRITRFNHAFEYLTGRASESVVGKPLDTLFPKKHRREAMHLLKRTSTGERWESVEIPILHVNGEIKTVLWNSATLYKADGKTILSTIAQGQDITARKQAEEELVRRNTDLHARNEALIVVEEKLRQSNEELTRTEKELRQTSEYLEKLFDYANAPIIIWDRDFRIIRFNHAFEHLTGYKAEDVIGDPLDLLFPPESREISLSQIQRTLSGEHWESVEIPIRTMEGRIRIVLWNSATLFAPDTSTVLVTIAQGQDITERKMAEESLKEYAANLKRSNEDLERFAYVASHDLQEPIRNIVSFSQLLARRYKGRLGTDADEFIEYIVNSGKHMQNLVTDLLEYSRVASRGRTLEPTDTGQVLENTLKEFRIRIESEKAVITHDALPVVMADANQLQQVFQNLIGNALKFRSEEPPKIHISAQKSGNMWRFSVRDNGIGIDPEFRERIFIIFQRLHTRDRYPGTGMGLAIVKRIIERHGGEIWVESELGMGSTFNFTLQDRISG